MEAHADVQGDALTRDPDRTNSSPQTASLLQDLGRLRGSRCSHCAGSLCGHDALFSVVLGFKDAPRCLACLGGDLGRGREELRDQLREYCEHRDCYREGWLEASREEGFGDPWRPGCLYDGAVLASEAGEEPNVSAQEGAAPDAVWNAGSMGCGDLVLELRARLGAMRPGQLLAVIARDPGAPEDLPAWCRLTGHALVMARHPDYRIRRKES